MPSTHLIITDLPVPEPPMTTSDCPLSMVRSRPSSTTFRPKRFFTPRSSTFAVLFACTMSGSLREEHGGEDIVRGKDQDRRGHNRVGRCRSDALSTAFGVEAVVTAHQRDDEAE